MNRKFKKFFLVALILLFVPVVALAASFQAGENLSVEKGKVVENDLYLTAGNVKIDGTVKGDVIVGGGQIDIGGKIEDDLFVVGGTVNISGTIGDNVRVFAGNVTVTGQIKGDLLASAGTVAVAKDAKVDGELWAAVGNLEINGNTGKAKIIVGEIKVGEDAVIRGDLEYSGEKEGQISSKADIKGKVTFNEMATKTGNAWERYQVSNRLLSLLITFVIALLVIYLIPNATRKMNNSWRNNFGRQVLWGLLALVAIPLAGLILLITVIGAPLGVALLMLYPIAIYLGRIVAIIALGYCILDYLNKDKEEKVKLNWIPVAVGALVFYLVNLIPVVGWLVTFVIMLAGLGALVNYKTGLVKRLRASKEL